MELGKNFLIIAKFFRTEGARISLFQMLLNCINRIDV